MRGTANLRSKIATSKADATKKPSDDEARLISRKGTDMKIKLQPDVDRLVDVFTATDGGADLVLFNVAVKAAEKQANSGLDAGAVTICEMIHKFRLLTDAMIADQKRIAKPEWSGSPAPESPDEWWIDDKTGEYVNAWTHERMSRKKALSAIAKAKHE